MNLKPSFTLFVSLILLFLASCRTDFKEPQVSLESYRVAPGFELELVASEPLVNAPVSIDFDNKGRMWVLEMPGFMPNVDGSGEEEPNGKIKILEDRDDDGVVDHVKVFLDSLVLPRAIAHVYGGLLYAEPPNLWFVEIKGDKPGKRTLVDSLYAPVGNVEHMPNGLLMNIDNWIYNSNSNFRYQRQGNQWKKEPTTYRGQWGIDKDNWGRLYYNNNTTQLIGDYVLPNLVMRNPYFEPQEAVNRILTEDQRVFPLHSTTVNRGYDDGILDEQGRLVNFTAACSPLVYKGDYFPAEFDQNVFVCEPAANLIKRNVLSFEAVRTTAKRAYEGEEFIASTDEAFRPVKLASGPDGALYIADMHRGVLQHRADITPYYEENVVKKKLDTIVGMGRILRVVYKGKRPSSIPDLDKASPDELISLLTSRNGWLRDRAQQLLIHRGDLSVSEKLKELVKAGGNEVGALHALHALNGLGVLSFDFLREVVATSSGMLRAHAIVLMEQFATLENVAKMSALVDELLVSRDTATDLYVALALERWRHLSDESFVPVLTTISERYSGIPIFQEAVVSSLNGYAELSSLAANAPDIHLKEMLTKTIRNRGTNRKNPIFVRIGPEEWGRKKGYILFRTLCASCHGFGGDGISNLAPPLKDSEYVTGPVERLALIILKGMEGPLHVNGKRYELNASMPAFENNLSDEQIADIIEYLRNAFYLAPQFAPKGIDAPTVAKLREQHAGTMTEEKLSKIFNK